MFIVNFGNHGEAPAAQQVPQPPQQKLPTPNPPPPVPAPLRTRTVPPHGGHAARIPVPPQAIPPISFQTPSIYGAPRTLTRYYEKKKEKASPINPQPEAPNLTNASGHHSCSNCGKRGKYRCSRCMQSRYCSRQCQEDHWEVHKPSCVKHPTYKL